MALGAVVISSLTAAVPGYASTAAATLKPVTDIASANVQGVTSGSTSSSSLWQAVDDGTSFTSADDNTTRVETRSGQSGSHTVGYSGAPSGTVSQVTSNIRARRTKFASATVRVLLYDGPTQIASGPTHSVGTSYGNFRDTFSGLNVASGNNLRTRVELRNSSSRGSVMYTQIWLDQTAQVGDSAPIVSISSPTNGSSVSGTLTVTGTAGDDVALNKVEVQIDGGAFQLANGTASWAYSWNTSGYSGSHVLTARAIDSAGQTASTSVTVSVGSTGLGTSGILSRKDFIYGSEIGA